MRCFVVLSLLVVAGIEACIGRRIDSTSRTWTFSVTGRRGQFDYYDQDGNPAGFHVDIANAVCKIADKSCGFVKSTSTDCATNDGEHFKPGKGLMDGVFDACPGRAITEERLEYVSFTLPYYKTDAHFFVKPGNPLQFDEGDVTGRTITILSGTYTNDACLQKYGLTGAQYLLATGRDEAISFMLDEKADAFFAPRTKVDGLERLPGEYNCALGGTAVMVRQDNSLPDWWNPAFLKLVKSGQYQKICDEAPQRHGGPVDCLVF